MQFELTKQFLEELREAIAYGKDSFIPEHITELHPADIAEILDEVTMQEAQYIYKFLEEEKAADVMVHLEEDVREKFLESLTSKEIAEQVIENIDSDDAADVIAELPDEKKEEVISHLEDEEQASDIVDLLTYDEDSAGGLMGKELVKVNENWTVATAIREMRSQAEDVDQVYTIYVVDDKDTLLGRLSIKNLLFASSSSRSLIKDLFTDKVRSVTVEQTSEEVANLMEKYDLVVLPVVDEEQRLLGRITIDDVVDVIKEEAEKDYQMASGISEKVESSDKVWRLSRARLPWLLIGLIGGILGAQVIGLYENEIQIYPEMAFFIPLIAAMGGNVGVQSSAIIVQGLANNSLGVQSIGNKLLKELGVAMVNGIICSIIILVYNIFTAQPLNLGLTVSISLFSVIIFAGLFGTFVPLVLNKYKVDPALATGPFITTMNDVFGLLLYFVIGWLMYF